MTKVLLIRKFEGIKRSLPNNQISRNPEPLTWRHLKAGIGLNGLLNIKYTFSISARVNYNGFTNREGFGRIDTNLHFQKETFNSILEYESTRTNKAQLKQIGVHGILFVRDIKSMEVLVEFLGKLHKFVNELKAGGNTWQSTPAVSSHLHCCWQKLISMADFQSIIRT